MGYNYGIYSSGAWTFLEGGLKRAGGDAELLNIN